MKSENIKTIIGSYRWHLLGITYGVVIVLCLLAIVKSAILPQLSTITDLKKKASELKNGPQCNQQIAMLREQRHVLDSLMQTNVLQQNLDETAVVKSVYAFADSAHCSLGKVEYSKAQAAADIMEIPLSIRGQGRNRDCGKFISSLENAWYPVRIKTIDFQEKGKDIVTILLDCAILQKGK
ncbi:MAG: hypothetical protein PHC61_00915 [Chitinivibrionales bacterium]|nr:hypothetical protein [Chitinivibrionales bacterium]